MTDYQYPAHLLRRSTPGLAGMLAANLSSGAVPYLSIKGSRFTLVDATGNQRSVGQFDQQSGTMFLDAVIFDANEHISKVYYEGAYDPNADQALPPTCFSDNGVAPSSHAQKPQSKTCAGCPNNMWGSETSRLSGKATKACNDVQKVAITFPGDSMVFLLRVPPASLKRLSKYVREIESFMIGDRKADITDMITRISFEKDAIGILAFQAVAMIDEQTMEFCDKVREAHGADVLLGKLDKPYTGDTVALAPPRETVEPARTLPPPRPVQGSSEGNHPPLRDIPTRPAPAIQSNGEVTPPKKGRGRPRKEEQGEAPTQAPFLRSPPPGVEIAVVGQGGGSSGGATITERSSYAAPAASEDIEDIPDFLKRPQPGSAPAPKPAGTQFGMVASAPAPDEEMRRKINAAMGLPT